MEEETAEVEAEKQSWIHEYASLAAYPFLIEIMGENVFLCLL